MVIKLPKNLGTVGMLKYMIDRIIIQANLVKSELEKEQLDQKMIFTHIYTLHGYANLTIRVLKKWVENTQTNKQ